MDHTRAVRPPPGARRNLFQGTRRQNPTAVRPDTVTTIFQQPLEDEIVERKSDGEYVMYAPQTVYRHMALGLGNGRDSDEETGMFDDPSVGENGSVDMTLTMSRAGEPDHRAVWTEKCALGQRGCRGGG